MSALTVVSNNVVIPTPARHSWARIERPDQSAITVRFIRSYVARMNLQMTWWVDRGFSGVWGDDLYVREAHILSVTPAEKPRYLLSFCDSLRDRKRVGWYDTIEEAQRAADPIRSFASSVQIKEAP